MQIIEDDLTGQEIKDLLQRHADEMEANSPPGSCHYLDLDGLRVPEITFWSVREGETLLGCGALKDLGDGNGEIKSMHVQAGARGKGVANIMLEHILGIAVERSFKRLSLETGALPAFIPARKLYEKYGFEECSAFGDYQPNVNSVFMTKFLT